MRLANGWCQPLLPIFFCSLRCWHSFVTSLSCWFGDCIKAFMCKLFALAVAITIIDSCFQTTQNWKPITVVGIRCNFHANFLTVLEILDLQIQNFLTKGIMYLYFYFCVYMVLAIYLLHKHHFRLIFKTVSDIS